MIIGGVSEPIEFLFLFVSPLLFVFHAFMNGFANMVLPYMGVKMGFTGDLIQFISFGVLRHKNRLADRGVCRSGLFLHLLLCVPLDHS